jgi:hypothetical protein
MTMADETRDELSAWVRECGGYFMRSEQGDAGKLVRLDRVRRWLMAGDDGLPHVRAGEALLAPLEALPHSEIAEWLHLACEGDAARRVTNSDDFEYLPFVDLNEVPTPAKPEDSGVRGALRFARKYWCTEAGAPRGWHGQHTIEPLAVPVAKAHELWSWGEAPASLFPLADWPALVAYRLANPNASWAGGNQIELGVAEFQARGGDQPNRRSPVLEEMALELRISRQSLLGSLWRERKRTGSKASPLPDQNTPWRRTG